MTAIVDANSTEILSKSEQNELLQLEEQINVGILFYHQVGKALGMIQEKRLYRSQFKSFESYCQERWDLNRSHAYRLIDAAKVVADLSPIGDSLPLPLNESQCRVLKALPAERRKKVWNRVLKKSNDKPTAQLIQEEVETDRLQTDRNLRYHRAKQLSGQAYLKGCAVRNGADEVFEFWKKQGKPLSSRQQRLLRDDVQGFCDQFGEIDQENKVEKKSDGEFLKVASMLCEFEPEQVAVALFEYSDISYLSAILQVIKPESLAEQLEKEEIGKEELKRISEILYNTTKVLDLRFDLADWED